MAAVQKDPIPFSGSPAEEIVEAIRSEPVLAWFLAQALWIAQPALEAFWPQEKITAVADLLESVADSNRGGAPGQPRVDGGGRK